MEKDEKITRIISEMMADYRADQAEYNAQIEKGKQLASMMLFNLEKMTKAEDGKRVIYKAALQAFASELFEWYESQKAANADNIKQWREDIKPIIDMVRQYQRFAETYNTDYEEAEPSDTVNKNRKSIEELTNEIQEDIQPILEEFSPEFYNRALIDRSPIMRNLVERNNKPFLLNRNDGITLEIVDGYLTNFEKEILEDITLCILEGRVTEKNRVIIPICRLYEMMRGGHGKKPSKKQQTALLERLNELERKIEIIANKEIKLPEKYFGEDATTTGGKFWIITFDEIYTKNKGQPTTYLMLPNVPLICGLLYEFGMFETVSEELKAIKEYNPSKNSYEPVILTDQRIAIRQIVFSFVFKYRRARENGNLCSNRLNYKTIFQEFNIKPNDRKTPKRIKDFTSIILDHLVKCEVIANWNEYTNKGSKKPDGVEVYLERMVE